MQLFVTAARQTPFRMGAAAFKSAPSVWQPTVTGSEDQTTQVSSVCTSTSSKVLPVNVPGQTPSLPSTLKPT